MKPDMNPKKNRTLLLQLPPAMFDPKNRHIHPRGGDPGSISPRDGGLADLDRPGIRRPDSRAPWRMGLLDPNRSQSQDASQTGPRLTPRSSGRGPDARSPKSEFIPLERPFRLGSLYRGPEIINNWDPCALYPNICVFHSSLSVCLISGVDARCGPLSGTLTSSSPPSSPPSCLSFWHDGSAPSPRWMKFGGWCQCRATPHSGESWGFSEALGVIEVDDRKHQQEIEWISQNNMQLPSNNKQTGRIAR